MAIAISGAIINNKNSSKNLTANTNTIVNADPDAQKIILKAKGGFEPAISQALPDKKTILEIHTDNTFDCSSSIIIPALKISKILPSTGITQIEIPPQPADSTITGICSMNMYRFDINFKS